MKDNTTYLSVGRVITLKKALAHIKMSIEEANTYLKENDMEVVLYE